MKIQSINNYEYKYTKPALSKATQPNFQAKEIMINPLLKKHISKDVELPSKFLYKLTKSKLFDNFFKNLAKEVPNALYMDRGFGVLEIPFVLKMLKARVFYDKSQKNYEEYNSKINEFGDVFKESFEYILANNRVSSLLGDIPYVESEYIEKAIKRTHVEKEKALE